MAGTPGGHASASICCATSPKPPLTHPASRLATIESLYISSPCLRRPKARGGPRRSAQIRAALARIRGSDEARLAESATLAWSMLGHDDARGLAGRSAVRPRDVERVLLVLRAHRHARCADRERLRPEPRRGFERRRAGRGRVGGGPRRARARERARSAAPRRLLGSRA